MGAWRLAKPPLKPHHAVIALAGTLCAMMYYRGAFGELVKLGPLREHTVASLLFAVGFYGGVVSALAVALKKPQA
jgi:hypothetical protein